MKLNGFLGFFFFSVAAVLVSWAKAETADTVLVPDQNIKTPEFHEGAILGNGVVEKEFIPPLAVTPSQKSVQGKKSKRVIAKVKAPERSIASFQEDVHLPNATLMGVRQKDQSDREETLAIVRAAILRGEFGKAAKENLLKQK